MPVSHTALDAALPNATMPSMPHHSLGTLVAVSSCALVATALQTAHSVRADAPTSTVASAPAASPPATKPSAEPGTPPTQPVTPPEARTNLQTIAIPKTTQSIELVRGPKSADGKTLWIGRTEVTWDLYDVFVYGLDQPDHSDAPVAPAGTPPSDATARPSKPYVPPDRGFGHNGYPAMGMTFEAAKSFCVWLSTKTGKKFRLPTEAEWEQFCLGDSGGTFACGVDASCLDETAWHAGNSDHTTKAVATRKPSALGLFDIHGNVAEWVIAPDGGKPLAKGGSFKDPPDRCAASFDLRQTSAWNASDPQIPKSKWWLADCSFVGFRVVLDE